MVKIHEALLVALVGPVAPFVPDEARVLAGPPFVDETRFAATVAVLRPLFDERGLGGRPFRLFVMNFVRFWNELELVHGKLGVR